MSKSNEQEPPLGFSEEFPASVVHRLPEEEDQLERIEFSKEKVLDFINNVQESPSYYSSQFELDLERAGLLPRLEESEVLPPRKALTDSDALSEEGQQDQLEEEREQVLKNLYLGTILANLFEDLFSKKNY